jgi:hypothetical protein
MEHTSLIETTHIHAIADIVCDRARVIFETMGYEKDFCIQLVSEVAVFGSTNRLIFNPKLGYYPDAGHCSPQFLAAYDHHYGTSEPEPELSEVNSITADCLADMIEEHIANGGVVLDYYRNDPPDHVTGVSHQPGGFRLKRLNDDPDGTFLLSKDDYTVTDTCIRYDVGYIVFLNPVSPA